MKAHPVAEWLPALQGSEWESFKQDIAAHGVRTPIVVHEDQILDGRNRWRAAHELGIECPTVPFAGGNVAAFVMSQNVHRRHLSTQERADIAKRLANVDLGANQHRQKEGVPNGTPSMSAQQAADVMSVSRRTVYRAKAAARDLEPLTPPPPRKAKGYISAGVQAGLLPVQPSGAQRRKVREDVAAQAGMLPEEVTKASYSPEANARVNAAIEAIAERAKPADERYAEHRREVAQLPKSAQDKLERLVAKEIQSRLDNFEAEVKKGVEAQIPETIAMYEKARDRGLAKEKQYVVMVQGIRAHISHEDYRFLLNALHPDRAPDREKLNACFHIIRRLEPYLEVVRQLQKGKASARDQPAT